MTTPAPIAPTLSIATAQPVYQPGDTVTLTATYVDSNGVTAVVTVNATATDTNTPPNTASASTTFQVGQASEEMAVSVTDTANDVYTQTSATLGTAVFTTTAPSIT
jgi:predicted carbohydrate-binding protein with CBM5 and CBM33 domain